MSTAHHPPDKLAARGVTLLMFGLIWTIIGIDVVYDPTDAGRNTDLIYTRLPIWFRCSVWAVPGLLAVAAFRNRRLQPIAFGMLTVAPVERLIGYIWAVLGDGNFDRISGGLVYLIVALMMPLLGRVTTARPPAFVVLPQGVTYLRQHHPEWIIETRPDVEKR